MSRHNFFLIIILSSLLSVKNGFSQNVSFYKYYSGGQSSRAYGLIQCKDKGFVMTGYSYFGDGNYLIIRTDSLGNLKWMVQGNDSIDNALGGIKELSNGDFIAVGEKGAGSFLIKIDSYGNRIWEKVLDPTYHIGEIEEINHNEYLLVGAGWDSTNSLYSTIIYKVDISGNILEFRKFNFWGYQEFPISILKTNDNNFIITGQCFLNSAYFKNPFLIKINSSCDTLWTKHLSDTCSIWDIEETFDTGFILIGTKNINTVLVKTNPNGEKEWQKTLNDLYGGKYIKQLPDSGYAIFNSTFFAFHIDKNTNLLEQKGFNPNYEEQVASGFIIDEKGDIFIVGSVKNTGGFAKILFVKIEDSILFAKTNYLISTDKIKIFPNPTNDLINIHIDQQLFLTHKNFQIIFYDVNGNKIYQTFSSKPENNIDIKNFVQGIYFYEIKIGKSISKGKFIIQ